MSYHYVTPTVCSVAIGKLSPKGVKAEDAAAKVISILRSEFGKIEFAESAVKSKASTFKRLKLNAKKQEASYNTRMAGDTKEVSVKAVDTYNWLSDVHEFELTHGVSSLVEVKVPAEIHDWITGHLASMTPSKEGVSAKDATGKVEPVTQPA
jgi:hypothetical protein